MSASKAYHNPPTSMVAKPMWMPIMHKSSTNQASKPKNLPCLYKGKVSSQFHKNVLNIANGVGYGAIKTLDDRANYFGAMYGYTDQPWFRVAEKHSRGQLKLADTFGFSDWISEAGGVIMRNGKTDFQYIYIYQSR